MELEQKVASLPSEAGVYLFKDALGTILYVGKARSLRGRVKSYFLESKWIDAKTGSLVREIADLDYIVVDNEKEALALENSLIKQHKPKFNEVGSRRSEEHTSELQSRLHLVCRLLLEKKKKHKK